MNSRMYVVYVCMYVCMYVWNPACFLYIPSFYPMQHDNIPSAWYPCYLWRSWKFQWRNWRFFHMIDIVFCQFSSLSKLNGWINEIRTTGKYWKLPYNVCKTPWIFPNVGIGERIIPIRLSKKRNRNYQYVHCSKCTGCNMGITRYNIYFRHTHTPIFDTSCMYLLIPDATW